MPEQLHQHVQQQILDRDWTCAHLQEAARLWDHVTHCDACREALEDYDTLRAILHPEQETGWDQTEPAGALDASGVVPADQAIKRVGRRSSWRWAGAVAALLAVAFAGWWSAGHFDASSGNAPGFSSTSLAAFLPQNPAEQASVFDHVTHVFDHRASWIALSPDNTQMGLASQPIGSGHPLMVFRLSLLHANKPISQTDLVIPPGQSASLDVPLGMHRVIRYRVAVSNGAKASMKLWAEVRSDDGAHRTLAAISRRLDLRGDQVANVGQLIADGAGYTLKVGLRQTREGTGP